MSTTRIIRLKTNHLYDLESEDLLQEAPVVLDVPDAGYLHENQVVLLG